VIWENVIGFRQQLSMMSFEAFELKIVANYPVHTRTEKELSNEI